MASMKNFDMELFISILLLRRVPPKTGRVHKRVQVNPWLESQALSSAQDASHVLGARRSNHPLQLFAPAIWQ